MRYSDYKCFRLEFDSGVAFVSIDHPPINLLDEVLSQEFDKLGRALEADESIRVVVLQSAVSRLLALPVEVSYTLPEMLEALGSPFRYTRKDYFHFPLGHGLRAEALYAAWYKGQKTHLDEIHQQASLYLFAVLALLRSVRERASGHE